MKIKLFSADEMENERLVKIRTYLGIEKNEGNKYWFTLTDQDEKPERQPYCYVTKETLKLLNKEIEKLLEEDKNAN